MGKGYIFSSSPTGESAQIIVGIGVIALTGYWLWDSYTDLVDCKKNCLESTKEACNVAGNTGPYHACEAECVWSSFGGGGKGPAGPVPDKPWH